MKLNAKQIAKIHTLHKKGLTERAIAEQIGCSRSAVWGQLNKVKKS